MAHLGQSFTRQTYCRIGTLISLLSWCHTGRLGGASWQKVLLPFGSLGLGRCAGRAHLILQVLRSVKSLRPLYIVSAALKCTNSSVASAAVKAFIALVAHAQPCRAAQALAHVMQALTAGSASAVDPHQGFPDPISTLRSRYRAAPVGGSRATSRRSGRESRCLPRN